MIPTALILANGYLLAAPFWYQRRRLGVLLLLLPLYLAGSAVLLGQAVGLPTLAALVGLAFGVLPGLLLLVVLLDLKFGLFASDVIYLVVPAMLGLIPLGPVATVVWLAGGA